MPKSKPKTLKELKAEMLFKVIMYLLTCLCLFGILYVITENVILSAKIVGIAFMLQLLIGIMIVSLKR